MNDPREIDVAMAGFLEAFINTFGMSAERRHRPNLVARYRLHHLSIREANADEYAESILGDLRPAARSLAVCAARDDIANVRDALTNR